MSYRPFALTLLALVSPAAIGSWDFEGLLELESRYFVHEAAFQGQHDAQPAASMTFMPEIHFLPPHGYSRFTLVPLFRGDSSDPDRSFSDIKEGYWLQAGDGWDLHIGVDRVFWGVTESRHLVDIINQKDLSADIAEEDQLGQPMVNVGFQTGVGDINLFVLPGFRPRRFPGEDGRLRPAIPIDNDDEIFIDSAGEDHIDVAVRYFSILGDYDIGLSWFRGVSREPSFAPRLTAAGLKLVPVYEVIGQFAADVQLTRGPFLWKLETIYRTTDHENFLALVGGLEYTFYGINEDGWDLGVLIEYMHDERDPLNMPTPFEDDVYLGMRLALNDLDDTALLIGAIVDAGSHEGFLSAEFETRLADGWTLNLEARAIWGDIGDAFDFGIDRDDYLAATIGYAF